MASSNEIKTQRIPAGYEPISMWGYFGYQILFAIPIIGFILVLVFAFSAQNINLRNFARSQFCVLIIVTVAAILFAVIGAMLAATTPGVL